MKVKDLNEDQRGHLVYRLDHNTRCGLLTAYHVAKDEKYAEMELEEVFQGFDRSPRSAKALAKKVEAFSVDVDEREPLRLASNFSLELLHKIRKECGVNDKLFLLTYRRLVENLTGFADSYERLSSNVSRTRKTKSG